MANKYRFLEGKHLHQYRKAEGEVWENMSGASTIVGVLDKPGLTYWASGLAVKKLGWLNPKEHTKEERLESAKLAAFKIDSLAFDEYLDLLDEAYKAHSVRLADSAQEGTDLHKDLQEYVEWCLEKGGKPRLYSVVNGNSKVKEFADWAMLDVKRFNWSEAFMYDEELFVGGISDCGATMNDGSYVIIDFKSSKEAYFSHFIQIALYNLMFEKNGICTQEGEPLPRYVFPISKYFVIPFGAKEFTIYENDNVSELKEAAKACISLYRAKSNFDK